ncbi:MAG: hypothetical protein ABJ004_16670 [Cyclobacteriaceae bacterium]
MKRIEQIAAVFTFIGILMKLLLIPGGAIVLGISLTVLATIYYPIGFFYFNSIPKGKIFKKESYAGLTFTRGLGTFGGGLIFSILAIGSLFKLLQLPGAAAMLTIGLTAGSLFFIVTLIKYFMNRVSSFHRNMLVRTILIVGLSGILVATPSLTLVKIFFRDNPEYINAYQLANQNPNDQDLRRKAEEAREKGNN